MSDLKPCPFCGVTAVATDGMFGNVINCDHLHTCPLDGYEKFAAAISEWNTRAAPAEDVRAVGEEPVMRLDCEKLWGGDGEYAVDFVKPGWLDECRKKGGTFLLYRHPQRPVVLPDRIQTEGLKYGWQIRDAKQWNACLDAAEELNK